MSFFVVAAPLFNANMQVNAYRLCERDGGKLFTGMSIGTDFGNSLATNGLDVVEELGVAPFSGDQPLFVDMNVYQILLGTLTDLRIEPESLVCVLSKDIPQENVVLNKCTEMVQMGYSLAWNGLPENFEKSPFLEIIKYIILDYNDPMLRTLLKQVILFMQDKIVVIANIPDMNTFDKLTKSSKILYTGSFYNQPITKGNNTVSPLKINALQLLNQINQEDFDLMKVASTIERDPALSVSLLRFINSTAAGNRRRIDSIRSSVAILGQKDVKRWATIALSIQLAEDRPSEITRLSLIRAKFAENLAGAYELGMFSAGLFMAGLFSLIDVILQKPMHAAISEIAVDDRVRAALLDRKGEFFKDMDLIYSYERADWDRVSINMIQNNISIDMIHKAFLGALVWYKELLETIAEEPEEMEAQK